VTETDFNTFSNQYFKYLFNFMSQICVDFSWNIFIKVLKSLEFLWVHYVSLSFNSINMILIFITLIVVMSNNIIKTCNSLLFLHIFSLLNSIFFILTWFNTHYEFMQDSIYCSERCVSAALFSHQKSLLFALYTIIVFNARTLWICFFFIFSFFHLILWWCHSLKLIQYACWEYHLNDHHCCAHDF